MPRCVNPADGMLLTANNKIVDDKDKDGKLTLEEWGQSSRTRARFTKAKVKLKLPIDEAGFIAVYPASR